MASQGWAGRGWIWVGLYVSFLYISLPFMRPLVLFLYRTLGKDALGLYVNFIMAGAALAIVLWSFKALEGYGRPLKILLIFLVAALVVYSVETPEERLHFLQYGLLGWLVWRSSAGTSYPFLLSFTIVSLIGGGDEFIQWLLPNRVGDLRDVMFNGGGGLLGIWMGRIMGRQ